MARRVCAAVVGSFRRRRRHVWNCLVLTKRLVAVLDLESGRKRRQGAWKVAGTRMGFGLRVWLLAFVGVVWRFCRLGLLYFFEMKVLV